MNKLCIVTCNFGREDVLRLYCEGIKRIQSQSDVEIISIIVGEPNSVTNDYNCIHVPYKNDPLTEKFNEGCLIAKEYNPDYVMVMGSDNIFNIELLNQAKIHTEANFIAVRDVYFYALDGEHKSEMIYILSSVVGCARFVRADLMDKVSWTPWKRHRNKGIDQLMWQSLYPFFDKQYIFVAKDYHAVVIDYKTAENINTFDKWKAMPRVDPSPVLSFLSEKEKELLANIIN